MLMVPYNSISWTIGGISLLLFAWRSYLAYRNSGNTIARIYSGLSSFFGLGFLLYGVPGFFTLDPHILNRAYLACEICLQIGMQFQVWLLWFIGLRNRIKLRWMFFLSLTISLGINVLEALSSQTMITNNPLMVTTMDTVAVLILKSTLYIFVCWPLGYFFITQARHQVSLRTKLSSYATGIVFLVVSAGAVSSDITVGGSDTYSASLLNAGIFLGFMVVNLIPRRVISYEHRVATKGI